MGWFLNCSILQSGLGLDSLHGFSKLFCLQFASSIVDSAQIQSTVRMLRIASLTVLKCCFEPWNAKGKEGQRKEDETLHNNLYNNIHRNINRIHLYNMTTN